MCLEHIWANRPLTEIIFQNVDMISAPQNPLVPPERLSLPDNVTKTNPTVQTSMNLRSQPKNNRD